MIYTLLKVGHLVALFVWIGGMVAVALALSQPVRKFLVYLKTYDRLVTSPAMIAAWTFGILLAVQGNWFAQPWLIAKITLVLVLSGLHGVISGKLRRATQAADETKVSGPILQLVGLALLAAIVFLVIFKP